MADRHRLGPALRRISRLTDWEARLERKYERKEKRLPEDDAKENREALTELIAQIDRIVESSEHPTESLVGEVRAWSRTRHLLSGLPPAPLPRSAWFGLRLPRTLSPSEQERARRALPHGTSPAPRVPLAGGGGRTGAGGAAAAAGPGGGQDGDGGISGPA